MNGIREAIADPQKLTLVAPAEIGFFYFVVIGGTFGVGNELVRTGMIETQAGA